MRCLPEACFGLRGKREYIQTLRLLEDFPERQMTAAVQDAVRRRLVGFDAVKHLLLARIERRPAHLDLSRYPHLPRPFVAATRSADYAALLAGRDEQVRTLPLAPGTLNVFKGKSTAHRTTPVEGGRARIIAVFSYYETPDYAFSDAERLGFYGRTGPDDEPPSQEGAA